MKCCDKNAEMFRSNTIFGLYIMRNFCDAQNWAKSRTKSAKITIFWIFQLF